MDEVEIKKNECGGVESVKITHREPDHVEGVGFETSFHFRIRKECNHITELTLTDEDHTYATITMTHTRKLEIPYDELAKIEKAKLAMQLIGARNKQVDDLTAQEKEDVCVVYRNIDILTKEEYEEETKK